ncbi:MAG: hypothetical protein HY678_11265 [Chloroflexi bacterium]|nr:hypothetical protein [Chloroflexota bacterium]
MAESGAAGVVLPRSALTAQGLTSWRKVVLEQGRFHDATILLNSRNWVFDEVHPQLWIALTALRKGTQFSGEATTRGPFGSMDSYARGIADRPARIPVAGLLQWSDVASFPLIPSPRAGDVYLKMRQHSRFDSPLHPWKARPVREFDATNDKHLMILDPKGRKGLWPVYGGESFNLWEPDTGRYYAWIDPKVATDHLLQKRRSQARTRSSAFYGMPPEWINDPESLSLLHPRVVFRDVTQANNLRTVLVALVPPRVALTNKAPYLLSGENHIRDEAFVLGVMASIPFDWVARRHVEVSLNFYVLNSLPVPLLDSSEPLRRRVEEVAGRLAAVDERYAEWASVVGVKVASVKSESERQGLIYEIDALIAKLYGLDESDIRVIFETFHVGWDYQERLDAVLHHFRKLR